jgi:osmoprotectant transport system permease protein
VEIRWDWIDRHAGDIWAATVTHLWLTLLSVVIAAAISIPAGIAARNSRLASGALLGASGVLYTVPSIALFGILVPFTGIGALPVVIGLVVYSLLVLVRNTIVGLRTVPVAAQEAARAVGMTPRQVLWRVELPLAVPAIAAGVRVATVTAVGIATLGVLVGGGGLGEIIWSAGVRRDFDTPILAGAVAATALALVLDLALLGVERAVQPWRRATA